MKVVVRKEWHTIEIMTAPDGLSDDDLVDWLRVHAPDVANEGHEWELTVCEDETGRFITDSI